MKYCKDCRYCYFNYEWDGEEEFPYYFCHKYDREVDADESCEQFKKLRIPKYKEKDTICDKCEYFSECTENKLEITGIEEIRSHFLPYFSVVCRKM